VASQAGVAPKGNPIYSCIFTAQGWDTKDWMFVHRRDMKNRDEWTQKEDCLESKEADPDSHTSMVYAKQMSGDLTVSCTMAFADRMAPSLVLVSKLGADAQQRQEYDSHIEIVLWDEGINVWSHHTHEGKDVWQRTAYYQFPLTKNTKYKLQVTKKGKELSITVAGRTFGYLEDALSEQFYIGITGSEGITRFYDFAINQATP
jgi:hypothetical protein